MSGLALRALTYLGPPAIAAFGWVWQHTVGPSSRPTISPAQQSDNAEHEADKEAGAPTVNCPDCPPAQSGSAVPLLPANPDDLLGQGWEETTHPDAAANSNRRRFHNTQTGQVIEFDKARPGQTGFEGQDHYHVPNPDPTAGKRGSYLDQNGNPVPRGSTPSHILPDE